MRLLQQRQPKLFVGRQPISQDTGRRMSFSLSLGRVSGVSSVKYFWVIIASRPQSLSSTQSAFFGQSRVEDGSVVADRGYNQANLEAAAAGSSTMPSYEWVSTNPNDLRIIWPDGSRKDVKVTQRATDYQKLDEGRLWSSEVQRVTTDNGANSVPSVTARRVVTKYRWENNVEAGAVPALVQAVETVYDLGVASDPLKAGGGSSNSNILSKSRIIMQKVKL